MKIAICYENGQIYQHFGSAPAFKLYNVADGAIVSSEIVETNGSGHGALAAFLAERGAELLICGGMGRGAMEALSDAGIAIVTGAEGSADAAVEAYLNGELESAGVNCDHHHGEEGGECGSGCGGGCSSCGGGCGGSRPIIMEGKNAGKNVKVHYRGTLNDGTQFDSSYDRGQPLEFVCATGMMIKGFDAAVVNMEVGESVDIHLMPEEAYGEADPEAIFTLKIAELQGAENLQPGQHVYLTNAYGQPFPVVVAAMDAENITFDANHEMAGKELNFHIELLSAE